MGIAIQDEAVVDEMMEYLEKARKTAKTPIDRRALDLLEVLTRRRAAEMKNQPGQQADKALEAMKRAFDRDWVDGEHRLMADFLSSMATIASCMCLGIFARGTGLRFSDASFARSCPSLE